MITRINEGKILVKYISYSVVQNVLQIKNGVKIHVNMSVKSVTRAKKDYSRNLSTCICDDSRYLKSIVDDSIIVCDINVMDSG